MSRDTLPRNRPRFRCALALSPLTISHTGESGVCNTRALRAGVSQNGAVAVAGRYTTMYTTAAVSTGSTAVISTDWRQRASSPYTADRTAEPAYVLTLMADINEPRSLGSHTSPAYARHGAFVKPMASPMIAEHAYSVATSPARYSDTWTARHGTFASIRQFLWPSRSSSNEDSALPTGVHRYRRLPADRQVGSRSGERGDLPSFRLVRLRHAQEHIYVCNTVGGGALKSGENCILLGQL